MTGVASPEVFAREPSCTPRWRGIWGSREPAGKPDGSRGRSDRQGHQSTRAARPHPALDPRTYTVLCCPLRESSPRRPRVRLRATAGRFSLTEGRPLRACEGAGNRSIRCIPGLYALRCLKGKRYNRETLEITTWKELLRDPGDDVEERSASSSGALLARSGNRNTSAGTATAASRRRRSRW